MTEPEVQPMTQVQNDEVRPHYERYVERVVILPPRRWETNLTRGCALVCLVCMYLLYQYPQHRIPVEAGKLIAWAWMGVLFWIRLPQWVAWFKGVAPRRGKSSR